MIKLEIEEKTARELARLMIVAMSKVSAVSGGLLDFFFKLAELAETAPIEDANEADAHEAPLKAKNTPTISPKEAARLRHNAYSRAYSKFTKDKKEKAIPKAMTFKTYREKNGL